VDKRELLSALLARVEEMADRAETGRAFAQTEANQHKGAMASRYDTFKQEAQFLADAQRVRLAALREEARALRTLLASDDCARATPRVRVPAVVAVRTDEQLDWYLLAPAGGGVVLEEGDSRIKVITPSSRLGRGLLGKTAGDDAEVQLNGALAVVVVEAVR
jgi:transcription elongation GreA/GreB family factor